MLHFSCTWRIGGVVRQHGSAAKKMVI